MLIGHHLVKNSISDYLFMKYSSLAEGRECSVVVIRYTRLVHQHLYSLLEHSSKRDEASRHTIAVNFMLQDIT